MPLLRGGGGKEGDALQQAWVGEGLYFPSARLKKEGDEKLLAKSLNPAIEGRAKLSAGASIFEGKAPFSRRETLPSMGKRERTRNVSAGNQRKHNLPNDGNEDRYVSEKNTGKKVYSLGT